MGHTCLFLYFLLCIIKKILKFKSLGCIKMVSQVPRKSPWSCGCFCLLPWCSLVRQPSTESRGAVLWPQLAAALFLASTSANVPRSYKVTSSQNDRTGLNTELSPKRLPSSEHVPVPLCCNQCSRQLVRLSLELVTPNLTYQHRHQ